MEQQVQVQSAAAGLTFEALWDLGLQMFTAGADSAIVFILDALAAEPTIELCFLVKDVVRRIWESKQHRGAICRSPERPDLRLSQEEAAGYLLGAALGIELLPQEVRVPPPGSGGIGRQVEYYAGEEKRVIESKKQTLKSKKKSARDKAAKDEAAAAVLETTLATLDSDAAAERARRRAELCPLPLPDRKSKIVKPPAPLPAPPAPPAAKTASRLHAAAEKAEAAAATAAAHATAARRRSEKADTALEKLSAKRLAQSTGGWRLDDEAWEQLLRERAQTDEENGQLSAIAAQLRRERIDAEFAADDARYAAKEAREDVVQATREATREREAARLHEQMEQTLRLERERLAAEAEAAEARIREAEDAELEQLKQRLRKERAQFEFEMRESQREVARSQWHQ
eukprot:7384969-Prymnesium_polylepis.1